MLDIHIWNQIDDFEAKVHQKCWINFEQNGSCGQTMLLLKLPIGKITP